MKPIWLAAAAIVASPIALAQTTIYKLVDESGRVTYSNKPMKGAVVLELDPITTIAPAASSGPSTPRSASKPAVAVVTPRGASPTLASVDRDTQKTRDDVRRKILEEELSQEERSLADARKLLLQEQQNPTLIAAVRMAQDATEPTAEQQAEMRRNVERASGRIRGLQSTVAEHEKNVEALKKELGALKP
jgi:hypothetical protein